MTPLLRASGICAIAGGLLRIADAFTGGVLPPATLALLYLVTDVLLLTGIAGLWVARRAAVGFAGACGLAVFVIGILTVRASAFGIGSYQLGAGVAALGLAVYALEALARRSGDVLAPVAWLAALASGILAAMGLAPAALTAAAGVAFGSGFVAAGTALLGRRQSSR